jgi:hypothetical protein
LFRGGLGGLVFFSDILQNTLMQTYKVSSKDFELDDFALKKDV